MASESLQNFSIELLKLLLKDSKDGNIFYSPLSIVTAFSMLLLGARNKSALQLIQGLKLNNLTVDNIQSEMDNLLTKCTTPLGVHDKSQLLIANGLFNQYNYQIEENFKSGLVKHYKTELKEVHFEDGKLAAKIINQWIEDKTQNKIKDMFNDNSFNSLTRLVLANAVYFKDSFKDAFPKKRTTKKSFYESKDIEKDVDMMVTRGDYNYVESKDTGLKMIILPFNNYHLKLLLILPMKRFGLNEAINKMSASTIRDLFHSANLRIVSNLELPKFKINTEMDLKTIMSQFGVKDIFDETADLTGISKDKLFVDKAIHKTFLDVNENGVEAAAATYMPVMLQSAPSFDNEAPVDFVADEPFLISVYHSVTDAVVFFGKINNIQ